MWQSKVLIQFFVSALPYAEKINFSLSKLINPKMYSVDDIRRRLPIYLGTLSKIAKLRQIEGATIFELGTGWCPTAPLLMYVAGAKKIETHDHLAHLQFELACNAVKAMTLEANLIATSLGIEQSTVESRLRCIANAKDLRELLSRAKIVYRVSEIPLSRVESHVIDIWYSYSVLENIPLIGVQSVLNSAKELLQPGGVWFSAIGCQDPFTSNRAKFGHIHYLKYSEYWWNFFTKNRLAFNNRLRERDFLDMLRERGMNVVDVQHRLDERDIERAGAMKLDSHFRDFSPEELAIHYTEIVATSSKVG